MVRCIAQVIGCEIATSSFNDVLALVPSASQELTFVEGSEVHAPDRDPWRPQRATGCLHNDENLLPRSRFSSQDI